MDDNKISKQEFRRHKFLAYQGYSFPWYVTLVWISFFIGGMIYFLRNVLLR
jgi:hypothetical protein